MLKTGLSLIMVLAAVTGLPRLAHADFFEVTLSNVGFADGGEASGTFIYDSDTDAVVNWNIMVTGGNEASFPPFTYSISNSTVASFDAGDLQPRITFRVPEDSRSFRITPTASLAGAGNVALQLDTGGGGSGGVECFNCNPFRLIDSGSLLIANASFNVTLSPGFNGSWFYPVTSGQGYFLDVFTTSVFMSWFTYDTTQPGMAVSAVVGDPNHRWLTMQGPITGNSSDMTIFVTFGGLFDDEEDTDTIAVGLATLTFFNCEEGVLQYAIDTAPTQSGSVPIRRISNANVDLCEVLSAPL